MYNCEQLAENPALPNHAGICNSVWVLIVRHVNRALESIMRTHHSRPPLHQHTPRFAHKPHAITP